LPLPRTNFQTMLKVTLIPGPPPRGRRNCKVLLQFQAHCPAGDGLQQLHKLCRLGQQVVRGTKSVAGLLKFLA
jgi:hypothetical protein